MVKGNDQGRLLTATGFMQITGASSRVLLGPPSHRVWLLVVLILLASLQTLFTSRKIDWCTAWRMARTSFLQNLLL